MKIIYLLSDVCTDYTWAYDSVCAMKADDAALLKAELEAGTCYNLVHSRQVDYFLEAYPYLEERLVEAIRSRKITLNPVRNMTLFGVMSLEEIVRSFYPWRRFARKHGLDTSLLEYANIQETPTAAWILPSIFANIGVKHLVRSLLPYECPWARRLEEPPVYHWEGPDGSTVLVRLRKEDYVEGQFVLKGVEAIRQAVQARQELATDAQENLEAIGLVGCYGDLSPLSKDHPAQKTAAIAAYNEQRSELPLLVDASHADYWVAVENEIQEKKLEIPTFRGDYGTSWEAWPACLAADFAGYRRAQGRAALADRLTALLSILDPAQHGLRDRQLEAGWEALISLADHAWNGSSGDSRRLNAALRRQWQQEANRRFDEVASASLQTLASRVTATAESLLVFNHQSWDRTGVARLEGAIPAAVYDPTGGKTIPVQVSIENGETHGYCILPKIPALGYRVFPVLDEAGGQQPKSMPPLDNRPGELQSPFYHLKLDPQIGAVASLFDRIRNVELVDEHGPYRLNEAVYTTAPARKPGPYQLYAPSDFSDAIEQRGLAVEIKPALCGLVFNELQAVISLGPLKVTTTYRLYHALDRLDITNEVVMPVSLEKEQLDFAFPFNVPERQLRLETPGAWIDPERERLAGAGQSVHAVRRAVDVFNEQYGVTLAMYESGLVQLGRRTTGEDPLRLEANATVLCLALDNVYDWNEAIHDQGSETRFTFRYSLRGHNGGFDPVEATHFGWEDELPWVRLPGGQSGDLPPEGHSFLQISPDSVILSGMRAGDEGGIVLRFWEVGEKSKTILVDAGGSGELKDAWEITWLEDDLRQLEHQHNRVCLPIKDRGLQGMKLILRPTALC
jgi:hypothetical protein